VRARGFFGHSKPSFIETFRPRSARGGSQANARLARVSLLKLYGLARGGMCEAVIAQSRIGGACTINER
jgi:hypothetical protein